MKPEDIGIGFDFQGTIAPFSTSEAVRRCSAECGISQKEIITAITIPGEEDLIGEENLRKCYSVFHQEIIKAKPYPEILQIIKSLREGGYVTFISSSGPCAAIEEWLKRNNAEKDIVLVYGREDGGKSRHIENIRNNFELEKVIMIGNEPRDFGNGADIEVAVNVPIEDWSDLDEFANIVLVSDQPLDEILLPSILIEQNL